MLVKLEAVLASTSNIRHKRMNAWERGREEINGPKEKRGEEYEAVTHSPNTPPLLSPNNLPYPFLLDKTLTFAIIYIIFSVGRDTHNVILE